MIQSSRYAQKTQTSKMHTLGSLPQSGFVSPNLQAVFTRSRSFAWIITLHFGMLACLHSHFANQTLAKAWPPIASLAPHVSSYLLKIC